VRRSTALPSGYVLLDGFEQWGRLDLFAAADGYGAFDTDVTVTLDAAAGGFSAADAWRNDIDGRGGLTKRGTGTLTLTGRNRYAGGTVLAQGTLVAGGEDALGHGDVRITDGTLRMARRLRVRGAYAQDAGTVEITLRAGRKAPLTVPHLAVLGGGAALSLRLDTERPPTAGSTLPVLDVPRLRGRFARIEVNSDRLRAVPVYTAEGLSVRLVQR
jgi:autotransporter-associated beta strand protein